MIMPMYRNKKILKYLTILAIIFDRTIVIILKLKNNDFSSSYVYIIASGNRQFEAKWGFANTYSVSFVREKTFYFS
jgi:hypothetical protein